MVGQRGAGWDRRRGERPPGPASPSLSRGGDTRTRPGRRPGPVRLFPRGGSPPNTAPASPLWGNFPTKGRRGEVRFWAGNFLPIRGWKTKGFYGAETSGQGINSSPPPFIFLNEITPQRRQNAAGIFAVSCISFLTKAGGDAIGIISVFYDGENLIFRDFVGGGGEPSSLPVDRRRGAGSPRRWPGPGRRGTSGGSAAGNRLL